MDLIHHSQTGNKDAFTALFHKYKNLVFKTTYLMLGDTNQAEDALQEIFISVHKSLSTFQPSKGAFTTWLHRITVNHCLNRLRRRNLFTLSLDEIPSSSLIDHSPSPESQLMKDETVQQALIQLSDKLRVVVIMRYYWDLPYAEIAQVLDIPLGTVKTRLSAAHKSLRKGPETQRRKMPQPQEPLHLKETQK